MTMLGEVEKPQLSEQWQKENHKKPKYKNHFFQRSFFLLKMQL